MINLRTNKVQLGIRINFLDSPRISTRTAYVVTCNRTVTTKMSVTIVEIAYSCTNVEFGNLTSAHFAQIADETT
jgi:hypothetical protein